MYTFYAMETHFKLQLFGIYFLIIQILIENHPIFEGNHLIMKEK